MEKEQVNLRINCHLQQMQLAGGKCYSDEPLKICYVSKKYWHKSLMFKGENTY